MKEGGREGGREGRKVVEEEDEVRQQDNPIE